MDNFYACWESLYQGYIPYLGIHMYTFDIVLHTCPSLVSVDPVNRQDHCPSSRRPVNSQWLWWILFSSLPTLGTSPKVTP